MEPFDDLDRLVEELESERLESARDRAGLDQWLDIMVERQASDLLLLAGEPPAFRIHGPVVRATAEPLDSDDIEALVLPALPRHAQRAWRDTGIGEGSYRLPGVGRFRVHLHRERGRAAAVVRALPTRVPSLASLGLPPGIEALTQLTRGLVIIGGATGSGKTTTLAAIVDAINRRDAKHVITIEDPVEYEHTNHRSVIQQVEVGADAPDFATALRSALRQAPDVIVVGEMRDPETMQIALAAGETGHLVLTTLHTTDVPSTLARMTDSFPDERQPTIRQEIAAALSAVWVQTLLPGRHGGRVAAAELLMVGYGARQHIRRNALQHLHQEMTMTRRHGSFTLEDSLVRLVKAGLVPREDAIVRANHLEEFNRALDATA
ncbi:MAG: PilT/PilU family type 4a pilus ATPase [Acidobacteriota bacterium]|jgi:twitching motility protein PilT|nr:MAG: type IV pili twitching motility protein PilT [Acidobacteriota bacterium]